MSATSAGMGFFLGIAMNSFVSATVAVAVMVSAAPAGAQVATPAPVGVVAQAVAPLSAVAAAPGTMSAPLLTLKSGTSIPLVAASSLTSKTAKIGDSITMKVARDVVVGGQIVIPADAIAVGEVTGVRTRGMMCRTGKIDAKLSYIEINGARVPLTMAVTVKGKSTMGAAGAIAGFLAFGPLAAVITGKSAVVAPGTKAKGRIVGDVAMAAIRRPSTTARASL
jgi:hypothetical protein